MQHLEDPQNNISIEIPYETQPEAQCSFNSSNPFVIFAYVLLLIPVVIVALLLIPVLLIIAIIILLVALQIVLSPVFLICVCVGLIIYITTKSDNNNVNVTTREPQYL